MKQKKMRRLSNLITDLLDKFRERYCDECSQCPLAIIGTVLCVLLWCFVIKCLAFCAR